MLCNLTENFDSANGFTLTQPERVYIDGGQVVWNVSRNGGMQYAYRSIPTCQGDIELTVSGRVDYASNNCGIRAGIGDENLDGISISFGFLGGGCDTNGYLIHAFGVNLDNDENYCNFTGTWLWINQGNQYTATLILDGSEATLSVPGVGSVAGQRTYNGVFNTLYVGLNDSYDWPECSGTIDSIVIKPRP
jgi:hypothetical protein